MPDFGGGYSMNPQTARANVSRQDAAGDQRQSGDQAGYMELDGATKDADCTIVNVEGGVSKDNGCCNLFSPAEGAQSFTCGTCDKVKDASQPAQSDSDQKASFGTSDQTAPNTPSISA